MSRLKHRSTPIHRTKDGMSDFPLCSAIIGSPCRKRVRDRTAQGARVAKWLWTRGLPGGIIAKDHNLLPQGDTLAMTRCTRWLRSLLLFACFLFTLLGDAGRFLFLCLRPSPALAAEILFLRKQLALYFVIPPTENHLRHLVMAWVHFYNAHRPHMSLGPGIPQPPASLPVPRQPDRHRLPASLCVISRPILGGLHHDYRLEHPAA